ncbi:density-regulated protein homolog [Limulus polyphemus]|uniref:Density-regulated protein n=1 Tax=Limulus polyphemus TaxID=6850 RepID=A0ABM1TG11_LIMPO|nr:density-regulated protein homolog [Limulus polyphemus]
MATEVETSNSSEVGANFPVGPQPGVNYPLKVLYCGECTMPVEYCEYYPGFEKCKDWLQKNLPEEFNKRLELDQQEAGGEDEKKRQKRGGKGMVKTKKKTEKEKHICLSRAPRGKKKSVTVVSGLKTFDIDLKEAAKFFAHKFSCGSSVTGEDELVIQGDVKDDLCDIIIEKWPEVSTN